MINEYRRQHPDASVRLMCQRFSVSRSWLYEKSVALEPSRGETSLRDAIERLCLDFPGYGYRRLTAQLHRALTAQLHRAGWRVNHKRVLANVQTESLLCRLQNAPLA